MTAKTGFTYDSDTGFHAPAQARIDVMSKVELRPILFADLDGACLNGHERHANGYCGSRPDIVKNFNQLIAATDCLIVITSAWRYLVHTGAMTVAGLEACLLTHGVDCKERVAGVTRTDASVDNSDRAKQCREWLRTFPMCDGKIAAVDDLTLDYLDEPGEHEREIPYVRTESRHGLTHYHAELLVGVLTDTLRDGITERCEHCQRPAFAGERTRVRFRVEGKATVYGRDTFHICRQCRKTCRSKIKLA